MMCTFVGGEPGGDGPPASKKQKEKNGFLCGDVGHGTFPVGF